ncbi:methyltransferase domain-containing protein [Vibrio sp. SM6]|uniref:Methyltransferase domain-containing protein n=1 Tax=Vibrio agarilyticus TaxID=2726741 RepID=A0A7X8YHB1_9VIBR|nr:methyltransferase domain-containing protein [Vibrio agarilyticus]NLS13177.1 methyltransferase domain-containing protein [Vibrio agarilyticus]
MKPALSSKNIQHPQAWVEMHNGPWMQDSIQTRLDEWCPRLFGYHMLKLGGLSCELTSCCCNIQHQVNVDFGHPFASVIADRYELPFVEKSFDAVVLAHQLEYCSDPHRLLREVDRVMMDDGHLILTGFNPLSLIGLSSIMPWRKHALPWSGRMFTPNRIKDWLGVLNYQVIHCDQYALFPYQRYHTMWTWLENSVGGWASGAGSFYFMVARKRTYPLKPIKPHWRFKRRFSPVGVMNREGCRRTMR